ncbi:hypothetical protein ERO13_A11G005700v2 [Gossypium hirsutum]|uniref:Uncharacterized protein n=6 Tax=Gossypium TaxID=3633 RepID=A0A1U8LAT9_GOSHI|nr:uncharacterized protein LOC107924368 [Gossypium hirsutum]KAB2055010.1 hypothetical protein ES319_A11G006100v1 [Gossypium barbadense]TYG92135.1 hypothetical protein ES288_A11G005900v1 [Gossypium darwinii]TYH98595.1 hypothetical protein ES332_A11G007500v1 [Gossypium tomentosum]TYJ07474.1 hypothetical protein E1A91_A11G006200v1 [Gossypium mustelinum]KAG4172598.1 hypothetical protein ERO13_A11G005700v2 [Gossypium hirsutum]
MVMGDNEGNKKRAREETEANSVPNTKLARVDLDDNKGPDSDSPEATRVEPDPDDGEDNLPETRRIPEELLNILDDSDPVSGPDPAIQGLDSVIRSFEEEILFPEQVALPETILDSGESRPELGFLFEASDDELGLPPSLPSVEVEQRFETAFDVDEGGGSGGVGFGEMMGSEFPIPIYEPFEFGIGVDSDTNNNIHSNNTGDFVALGGLFEPAADISELTWRPESLSAL